MLFNTLSMPCLKPSLYTWSLLMDRSGPCATLWGTLPPGPTSPPRQQQLFVRFAVCLARCSCCWGHRTDEDHPCLYNLTERRDREINRYLQYSRRNTFGNYKGLLEWSLRGNGFFKRKIHNFLIVLSSHRWILFPLNFSFGGSNGILFKVKPSGRRGKKKKDKKPQLMFSRYFEWRAPWDTRRPQKTTR